MNNSNLYRVVIIALCSSLLASCGDSNFPSDGFKSVKFEMNAHQLESIGFSCKPDKLSCEKKAGEKQQLSESETLFGKPADIDVELADNKASTIKVMIHIEEKQVVELFTKALGSPKIFEYPSLFGNKIRRYYWISSEGTSIVININLDEEPPQGIFKMVGPLAIVRYQDKFETSKLLDMVKKSSVRPKDF